MPAPPYGVSWPLYAFGMWRLAELILVPVGGRFKQVLKSLKRKHKVNRKKPFTYDMLLWLYHDFWLSDPTSEARCEIMRAVLLGCFF